jgi:multiple sugar transport system substrate-binding protein
MANNSRQLGFSGRSLRRRSILGWALAGSAGALLAACSQPPSVPTQSAASAPVTRPTAAPATLPMAGPTSVSTQAAASPAVPAATAAKSAATGTVDFTHWLIGGSQGIPTAKQIDDLWAKQFPSITLKDEIPNGDYWTAVLTRLAGGDAPDVMAIDNYNITALAVKGGAMPLDDLIKSTNYDLSIFYPISLIEGVYQGKRYGLPYIGSTRVLGYNIDLFTAAGLDTPDKPWDHGKWTWDSFLEVSQKLTKKDSNGRVTQFAFQINQTLWGITRWIYANGGTLLNEDLTKCNLDQPPAIQAVQFLQDLMYKYHVVPTAEESKGVNLQQIGRLAMWGDWRGNVIFERTFKFKWDITLPPIVPSVGKSALYKGNSMAIYPKTKNLDAAWQFAQFICGPEASKLYTNLGGATPVQTPEVKDVFLTSSPPKNNHYYLDPLSENYAKLLPLNPHWPEMETKGESALQEIFVEKKDVKTVLSQLKSGLEQILAQPAHYRGIFRGEDR